MRILFVSDPLYVESEIYNAEGYANLPMLQAMPCELRIATTSQQARESISWADIVLLESLRGVSFRDELMFLNDYDVFVGAFYCDVWRGPFWYQTQIHIDLNICVYRAVALKLHQSWKEGANFLWLPPRVDPVEHNEERPVDVVTWGARGREYPYRNYTYFALLGAIIDGTKAKMGSGITCNLISICGNEYAWYSIAGKRLKGPLYGAELLGVLSQCKICATGPVIQHGIASPVARYFENAAAGVVSITSYLDDGDDLGFKHGETVWDCGTEDFYPDINMLCQEHELRKQMSRKATDLIAKRHSIDIRAMELYERLQGEF